MVAQLVSLLGKAYIGLGSILALIGVYWGVQTLAANRGPASLTLLVPSWDLSQPVAVQSQSVDGAALIAGWVLFSLLLLLLALRAPFRLRTAAMSQRRLRELEREVLELRTLPLRQQEEDDLLAAEAHLDERAGKVMTQTLRLGDIQRDRDGEGRR